MPISARQIVPFTQGIAFHGTLILSDTDEVAGNALATVSQTLQTLHEGQVLRVLSDFPGMEDNLFSWIDHTNSQILAIDRTLDKGLGFYILKGDPWPVDFLLDTRAAPCPTPVVMAARQLVAMHTGQCLRLSTGCPAAVGKVDTWLRCTRHHLLGITEDARGVYRFYIRKT